jgi:hypothetical protein
MKPAKAVYGTLCAAVESAANVFGGTIEPAKIYLEDKLASEKYHGSTEDRRNALKSIAIGIGAGYATMHGADVWAGNSMTISQYYNVSQEVKNPLMENGERRYPEGLRWSYSKGETTRLLPELGNFEPWVWGPYEFLSEYNDKKNGKSIKDAIVQHSINLKQFENLLKEVDVYKAGFFDSGYIQLNDSKTKGVFTFKTRPGIASTLERMYVK